MKLKAIAAFAGACGVMIVSHESQAAYLSLGTQVQTTVNVGGGLKTVYRLYAVFSDPGDAVSAVGGSEANGAAKIQNTFGPNLGAGFYNNVFGQNTAPLTSSSGFFIGGSAAQWDTFATIGTATNDVDSTADDVSLSPGFPTFINGAQWGPTNSYWFTDGVKPQGMAGNGIFGSFYNFPDVFGYGVLIAQLTVNFGQQNAIGTLFVSGVLSDGTPFTATGQTFSTLTPVPGGLAVLGLAGLVCGRRRRA